MDNLSVFTLWHKVESSLVNIRPQVNLIWSLIIFVELSLSFISDELNLLALWKP